MLFPTRDDAHYPKVNKLAQVSDEYQNIIRTTITSII